MYFYIPIWIFFLYRFHAHGKMFAYILHKMVENKEGGVQNYECHFQHLFDTFAKMFGMISVVRYVSSNVLSHSHYLNL